MKNVTLKFENNLFSLIDEHKNIVFTTNNWKEIEDCANENDFNIVYYPKDLIYSINNDDDECSLFIDIKYGDGHDNLGGHNIKGLPEYVDKHEYIECNFRLNKKVSKNKIIKDMNALGAKLDSVSEDKNSVYIEIENNKIKLVDINRNIIYEDENWEDVERYAHLNKLDILFNSNDLMFSYSDDNRKLILNVRYGDCQYPENELKNKNILKLPNLVYGGPQYNNFILKNL